MRRVFGFCGLIGAGKTTAALHFVDRHGFARIRFAGPLKAMLRAMGLSEREIDGDLKEQPCDMLGGKTPRWAMQSIGTEWGRDLICGDLWIRTWQRACSEIPEDRGIVVDDVRFVNEAEAIRAQGGLVIRVERSGVAATGHISEQIPIVPDLAINNNGSLAELRGAVDYILQPLLSGHVAAE